VSALLLLLIIIRGQQGKSGAEMLSMHSIRQAGHVITREGGRAQGRAEPPAAEGLGRPERLCRNRPWEAT
jgi:hypothetical protein